MSSPLFSLLSGLAGSRRVAETVTPMHTLADVVLPPQTRSALDQALAHNQEIARMASPGMKKIPVWKQDQTLYRGETVPQAEGESLGPGKSKKYPHFVSTSLELEAPRRQLNEWATPARPFKIIYHIKSSTTGRNVAPYSQLPQEKEILFPAGSKFVMGQIVQQTADSKEIEASVH